MTFEERPKRGWRAQRIKRRLDSSEPIPSL